MLNGMELPLSEPAYLAMNGWELTPKKDPHPVFFFHSNDPNINIRLDKVPEGGDGILEVEFEIEWLSEETRPRWMPISKGGTGFEPEENIAGSYAETTDFKI